MIPLRDTTESSSFPIVNYALIAANALVYVIQLTPEGSTTRFLLTYGLVPLRYSEPEIGQFFTLGQQVFSFFSFMFLHGGFWHILSNMWSLYIFGDNVEDRLGSIRYLFFYLLCGLASGVSHLAANWHSQIPTVGASGAIAGVMGAYFLLFPRARILTLIPIFIFPYFVELPAFFFLGIWLLIQFISAAGSPSGGGVAWWAHIGGFLFGMICLKALIRVPDTGISQHVREKTARTKTHHLQAIHVSGDPGSSHLFGAIRISPHEAQTGTEKLVSIPWGFHSRLFRVTVPPNVQEGTILRLSSLGRQLAGEGPGDLLLRVEVSEHGAPSG